VGNGIMPVIKIFARRDAGRGLQPRP